MQDLPFVLQWLRFLLPTLGIVVLYGSILLQ